MRGLQWLPPITLSNKLKTLCVTLDAALTFEDYINHVALVWTIATHCYTVQNNFARDVCHVTTRQQYTVDLLCNLHWLPIRSRITLKVATLCYKTYQLNQPTYLHVTLEPCHALD